MQEQDSFVINRLKGRKVKALPCTEHVHADLLHGYVHTVVEDGGCRRQVIQRWGILGCWGGGQLPLGGSNLLRRIWDRVLTLPMPPHHLLRGWRRGPLRRLRGRCGSVGTRAGGGRIHRESTGLGVAATVVEWEATEADGDRRAVAGEEELDAAGGERGSGGDGKSRQTVRRVGKEVGRTIEDAMGRYSARFPARVDGGRLRAVSQGEA